MTPALRPLLLRWLPTGLWILVAIVAAVLAQAWLRLPQSKPGRPGVGASGPTAVSPWSRFAATSDVWQVLLAREDRPAPAVATDSGNRRFRLAGTFFVEGAAGGPVRRAVLDETTSGQQHLVSEGDTVSNAVVERILYDRVVLRIGQAVEEIWLDFAQRGAGVSGSDVSGGGASAPAQGGGAETNRFGVRVQEGRWQFNRPALLAYYQELLDEPERMVQVFDSMKPVRGDEGRITGYVVGVEGEADFFAAVGLRDGDVVRRVNSMPMTSRRRAEFLINEFLRDRMNVVVLDIERGGQPSKLVYEIRP